MFILSSALITGSAKPVDLVPLAGSLLHLLREFGVDFRMFILETELFQLGLDGKESQAVCKGGINI